MKTSLFSVNQALHPVQNEIIQQQVLLTDISGVIQQQYLEYIIRQSLEFEHVDYINSR
jgi:hypothetical protein